MCYCTVQVLSGSMVYCTVPDIFFASHLYLVVQVLLFAVKRQMSPCRSFVAAILHVHSWFTVLFSFTPPGDLEMHSEESRLPPLSKTESSAPLLTSGVIIRHALRGLGERHSEFEKSTPSLNLNLLLTYSTGPRTINCTVFIL